MSNGAKLRFGICGLGFMGRTHFNHLRTHPGAQVVALCDRDPQRRAGYWSDRVGNIGSTAAQRVDLTGIAVYASPQELIAHPDVDVVVVTLPTPFHAEVACQALAAGKHVLCEKPMARDLAGCDQVLRAARKSGGTLMIGQCIRFWPQYETIKQVVDEGRIGAVRFAKLTRVCSPPTYSNGNWLMDGAQSGGALLDLHVHDVDFAQHLFGVPNAILARGQVGPSGEIDHVFALHSHADGRQVWLEGGWHYHAPWPFEMAITVHGERGTLAWSSLQGTAVRLYAGTPEATLIECGAGNGWTREVDYFIERVSAGLPVDRCPPASSRTSVALALLEKRAILSGRSVRVSRASAHAG